MSSRRIRETAEPGFRESSCTRVAVLHASRAGYARNSIQSLAQLEMEGNKYRMRDLAEEIDADCNSPNFSAPCSCICGRFAKSSLDQWRIPSIAPCEGRRAAGAHGAVVLTRSFSGETITICIKGESRADQGEDIRRQLDEGCRRFANRCWRNRCGLRWPKSDQDEDIRCHLDEERIDLKPLLTKSMWGCIDHEADADESMWVRIDLDDSQIKIRSFDVSSMKAASIWSRCWRNRCGCASIVKPMHESIWATSNWVTRRSR